MQASSNSPANYDEKTTFPVSFSPFLATTYETSVPRGFCSGSIYSPRHDMIIACSSNYSMHFYDSTTFSMLRGNKNIQGCVRHMSLHLKTDTYLVGCTNGLICLYDALSHEVTKLKKCDVQIQVITFLDPLFYAFSPLNSKKVFLGDMDNDDVISFESDNSQIHALLHLPQRKILLAGLENGAVLIYCTDKLPLLPILSRVQAHKALVFAINEVSVNGREYIITAGQDQTVKIWGFVKGKMSPLRVIQTKEVPSSVVYLENYKMIAMACGSKGVVFVKFTSGKVESTVALKKAKGKGRGAFSMFLMKEKNMIGVTSEHCNIIELIQLSDCKKH